MIKRAIEITNIWKSFPANRDRPGLKEFIVNPTQFSRRNNRVFWALKDISLTVNKGECIGVVGRNGAGKSTFLSLLLGTILPTRGSIVMDGKKTPLLELGAGFHPDLTGVENIIINGVLLGLTKKEVLERMQDIIDFSELGDFINMPTRTYSSGMYMRLAFSVAIHTEPEILLIDEILAVGDASFHIKSYNALMNLIKGGVTTVYVSHDLDSVQTICDRVIWLDKGRIKREGDPASVIQEYTNEVSI
jgi:ABC-type polysaccharide/polyol phosphate transport system ATPase subunit